MDKTMESVIRARLDDKNKSASQPLIDTIYNGKQCIKNLQQQIADHEKAIATNQKALGELLVVTVADILPAS